MYYVNKAVVTRKNSIYDLDRLHSVPFKQLSVAPCLLVSLASPQHTLVQVAGQSKRRSLAVRAIRMIYIYLCIIFGAATQTLNVLLLLVYASLL